MTKRLILDFAQSVYLFHHRCALLDAVAFRAALDRAAIVVSVYRVSDGE
jgi:hypothetical protein